MLARRRLIVLLAATVTVAGWAGVCLPVAPSARAATLRAAEQLDVTGDHVADMLAVSSSGALYLYPGAGAGGLGRGRQVGSGWGAFDQVRVVGQFDGSGGADLVARSVGTGALWLWPGTGSGGFGKARQIGNGWGAIREVVAPGDWDGNGTPDLLGVRSSDGTLWLFPGDGVAGFGKARQIGNGWTGRDALVSAGDFDGDGGTDLISRAPATGELWLNRGDGRGGFASGQVIGRGWNGLTAVAGAADASGDRRGDVLARDASGRLLLYPGTGTGGFGRPVVVGQGWNGMSQIVTASVRGDATLPAYSAAVAEIDAATLARMQYSHRAGCPVATADLRLVTLTYYGFDRATHTGELVVHRTAATAITRVFGDLYAARYPVQRMLLVDAYRGSDHASMDANNTSAYNCRAVEGGSGWSEHASGTAIDINPVQNPYVSGSTVLPAAGRGYLDRRDDRPGMVVRGDVVVRAFADQGWKWGGDFTSLKDYQHFSASGR